MLKPINFTMTSIPDKYTNLLTISMPVFERKEFFIEALNSALNQTIKCNISSLLY